MTIAKSRYGTLRIVAELRRWKANLLPFLQISLDDYTSPYLPYVLLLQQVNKFYSGYNLGTN